MKRRLLLTLSVILALMLVIAPVWAAPKKAKASPKKHVIRKVVKKKVVKVFTTTTTTTQVQERMIQPVPPVAVLAPIYMDCADSNAAVAALQMTEQAVRNFGLEMLDPRDIDKALRDFRLAKAPADLYPPTAGTSPLSFTPLRPVNNPTMLFWPYQGFSPSRSGHLLWLARQLGARYVYGVEYKIRPKVTRKLTGQTLNGRCQIWLTIVEADPVNPRVIFSWYPPKDEEEFGVEAAGSEGRQTLGSVLTILGGMAAGGMIGKGSTTRVLGWAAMATPQLAGPVGSETEVQIRATDKAIRTVFTLAVPYFQR